MSVKTLLEKAMLRLGSRGGLRKSNAATHYPLNGDKATTFTAPTDGEITIAGTVATGKDHGYLAVDTGGAIQIQDRWHYCRVWGRVKKGDTLNCRQMNTDATEINFIPTVGGGTS